MITPYFRPANPATTTLESGEVHLWRYRFGEQRAALAEQLEVLNRTERKRAEGVANPERRNRFIESRVLLRYLLAGYLALEPFAIKIRKGKLGRPELDGRHRTADLSFNISHSDDLLVLAVVLGCKVGVDVERIRSRPGLGKVARRVFSDSEQKLLAATDESERVAAFYSGWTRKEALLKAEGAGVFRQANQTEVSLADVFRPQIHKYRGSREQARERCLLSFQPLDEVVGALAVAAGSWRIRYFAFDAGVFHHH